MLDLMEGLSRYREFAEEVAPPLSIDEVLEPARARSIRSGRLSGWPSLRVAAAATVMVLLPIGLPALLLTRWRPAVWCK